MEKHTKYAEYFAVLFLGIEFDYYVIFADDRIIKIYEFIYTIIQKLQRYITISFLMISFGISPYFCKIIILMISLFYI